MSLRLYVGEHLCWPSAIHFGLNFCSNNCFYCFANLNKPARRMETEGLKRIVTISEKPDSGGVLGELIRAKYPITTANDSDPFAKSNTGAFTALSSVCQSKGIPLVVQTRGGPGAIEYFKRARPTMVYVTIETDSEKISREISPGSPGPGARLEFIRALVRAGHFVIWGMNPYVKHWWTEGLPHFAEKVFGSGCDRVLWGKIHLDSIQCSSLPKAIAKRFEDEIAHARKRVRREEDADIANMLHICHDMGFNSISGSVAAQPGFFSSCWDRLGFPFYPILDDWCANLKKIGKGRPVLFDIDKFIQWAGNFPGSEIRSSIWREYVSKIRQKYFRRFGKNITAHTFRESILLLSLIEERMPSIWPSCFKVHVKPGLGTPHYLPGIPYLVYDPNGESDQDEGYFDGVPGKCLHYLSESALAKQPKKR